MVFLLFHSTKSTGLMLSTWGELIKAQECRAGARAEHLNRQRIQGEIRITWWSPTHMV
jgi:hypothetical protein